METIDDLDKFIQSKQVDAYDCYNLEMLGIEYPVFQGGMAWIAAGFATGRCRVQRRWSCIIAQEMLLVIMSTADSSCQEDHQ